MVGGGSRQKNQLHQASFANALIQANKQSSAFYRSYGISAFQQAGRPTAPNYHPEHARNLAENSLSHPLLPLLDYPKHPRLAKTILSYSKYALNLKLRLDVIIKRNYRLETTMAEEGELQEYQLVNAEGETLKSSRDYNGFGTATYPNGDVYAGDFKDGLRHGEGLYTYTSKCTDDLQVTYKGQWENNEKHGIGKQIYIGVGVYYGYWEKGQRNGEGVLTYDNQDVYSGNWKDGKKDGKGTYIFFQTSEKYIGTFKSGQIVQGRW